MVDLRFFFLFFPQYKPCTRVPPLSHIQVSPTLHNSEQLGYVARTRDLFGCSTILGSASGRTSKIRTVTAVPLTFVSLKNASIVGNSAQRSCKRKATASRLATSFRKEITTTKPLILFTFAKEIRGARSRPESDWVGKHSERYPALPFSEVFVTQHYHCFTKFLELWFKAI